MNNLSFIHEFKGFGNCESKCKVHVMEKNKITFICFEELDSNTGTSVTNLSEQLATEMVKKLDVEPGLCKFFETYPDNNFRKDRSFDEILYVWEGKKATHAHWIPANKEIFGFI